MLVALHLKTTHFKMPRGFLVKRTQKPGPVSYRVREEDDEDLPTPQLPISFASVITSTWVQQDRPTLLVPELEDEAVSTGNEMSEAPCAPAYSPGRPVGALQQDQSSVDRTMNSGSPILGESFPTGLAESLPAGTAAFASLGHRLAFLPSYAEMEARMGSISAMVQSVKRPVVANATDTRATKVQAKRPKTEKKTCRDEVTTSPVLGLRIREDPEDAKHRAQASSPLGGFVCQLCHEQYADPLSLAQHKCSRIVRVEYRCAECDKVFSCPANLASHRRWHKPRSPPTADEQQPGHQPEHTKENQSPGSAKLETAASSPQPSDSDEELYDCSHCNKKFRRQAYLRKHLALHNRPGATASATAAKTLAESQGLVKTHDMQREPLALVFKGAVGPTGLDRIPVSFKSQNQGAQQAHPCRFCPETLFSSTGLTRHINRCHPSETRQVILLQVPQQA